MRDPVQCIAMGNHIDPETFNIYCSILAGVKKPPRLCCEWLEGKEKLLINKSESKKRLQKHQIHSSRRWEASESPIMELFPRFAFLQGDQPSFGADNSESTPKSGSDNTQQFCSLAGEHTSPASSISFLSCGGP